MAKSRVSAISLLSRALVMMRTLWMLERTRARPIESKDERKNTRHEMGGTVLTKLLAHLSDSNGSFCEMLRQVSLILVVFVRALNDRASA